MTDRERIVSALESIRDALADPDADYSESELKDIEQIRASLEARLASEEKQ